MSSQVQSLETSAIKTRILDWGVPSLRSTGELDRTLENLNFLVRYHTRGGNSASPLFLFTTTPALPNVERFNEKEAGKVEADNERITEKSPDVGSDNEAISNKFAVTLCIEYDFDFKVVVVGRSNKSFADAQQEFVTQIDKNVVEVISHIQVRQAFDLSSRGSSSVWSPYGSRSAGGSVADSPALSRASTPPNAF